MGPAGFLPSLIPLGSRLAPVQGEVGAADPVGQAGRLHLSERLADQVDDLVFQIDRVGNVVLESLARWIVRPRAVTGPGLDRRRAGVIVRREQDDILARQSILGLDPLGHAVGECPTEGDDVARDEDDLVIARIRQCECLGGERVRHALRGRGPRRVSRHPDRFGGRRIHARHAGLPTARRLGRPRPEAEQDDPYAQATEALDDVRHLPSLLVAGSAP